MQRLTRRSWLWLLCSLDSHGASVMVPDSVLPVCERCHRIAWIGPDTPFALRIRAILWFYVPIVEVAMAFADLIPIWIFVGHMAVFVTLFLLRLREQ